MRRACKTSTVGRRQPVRPGTRRIGGVLLFVNDGGLNATLSHELRTPLNAMLGWLQISQRTNPGGESLDRALGSLERNARVQQRVVEDLLDISRIVSGKLQMNMAVVDLRSVLNGAVDVTGNAARTSGVAMRWDPPPAPLLVSGDAARLQQVFRNPLSNAVKFTPSGGTVTVPVVSSEQAYAVTVHDTGVGIDPGFLPRVFDRFQQADSSATREHGGLGLGLAIVKEIVALHGGTVGGDTLPGGGYADAAGCCLGTGARDARSGWRVAQSAGRRAGECRAAGAGHDRA